MRQTHNNMPRANEEGFIPARVIVAQSETEAVLQPLSSVEAVGGGSESLKH